jgi:hypothetical protein
MNSLWELFRDTISHFNFYNLCSRAYTTFEKNAMWCANQPLQSWVTFFFYTWFGIVFYKILLEYIANTNLFNLKTSYEKYSKTSAIIYFLKAFCSFIKDLYIKFMNWFNKK